MINKTSLVGLLPNGESRARGPPSRNDLRIRPRTANPFKEVKNQGFNGICHDMLTLFRTKILALLSVCPNTADQLRSSRTGITAILRQVHPLVGRHRRFELALMNEDDRKTIRSRRRP
jgi:hypothetical protein